MKSALRCILVVLFAVILPGFATAANVTVTVSSTKSVMAQTGLGVGSSVYDNYMVDSAVPGNLQSAGIKALRYPGGSYADFFHWQTATLTTGQSGYVASGNTFTNWMVQDVIPSGVQPVITVNYGSNPGGTGGADPSEASNWVQYANVTKGYGIKYWEIGNEIYGNGYYNGSGWECDLHYNSTSGRQGQYALSPTAYGSNVNLFVSAMKAADPTIKIGAVLTAYGFWPDASQGVSPSWNANVLQQCGTKIDFVIIHYYPDNGNIGSGAGTNLLNDPSSEIPTIVSQTRTLINAYCGTNAPNVGIAVTETAGDAITSYYPAESLFAADLYCSWIENGVMNVEWQELHHTPPTFLVNGTGGGPHRPWYGALMTRLLASVGDTFVSVTSDNIQLKVHATSRQDGTIGLLLLNENVANSQSVNVTINGASLGTSGTQYQFGAANFGANQLPTSGISTNSMTGLGNSFSISVPALTMTTLRIPVVVPNTPPVLASIPNQTVNVGQTVAFTASATDTDQPPQILTFSLLSGPSDATLNSTNGAFSWLPFATDANTSNYFTLKVADNGSPSMSATQSFDVIVNPLTLPTLSVGALGAGQLTLQVSGDAAPGPIYSVQTSTNLVNWTTVLTTNSPPFQWVDANFGTLPMEFYRVMVGPP
ncbi:MAG: putative Ig domain-containing protein [Verrucomicrobiota bacterium]